jgi:hypothetical protein
MPHICYFKTAGQGEKEKKRKIERWGKRQRSSAQMAGGSVKDLGVVYPTVL